MKLVVSWTIFTLILYNISAENFQPKKRDYEDLEYVCGTWRFRGSYLKASVKYAVQANKQKRNFERDFPRVYKGPFFEESDEYMMWPLRVDESFHENNMDLTGIFVVFDPSLESSNAVKGVITRLHENSYFQCPRADQSQPESNSDVKLVKGSGMGYNCGYNYFRDDVILEWLPWIESNLKNNWQYPRPFSGVLYQENLGYYISPISNYRKPGRSSKSGVLGTYFIVVDSNGKFIEVIAKMKIGDFIRCLREPEVNIDTINKIENKKKLLKLSHESSGQPSSPVSFLENGHQCGKEFFSENYQKVSAKLAKTSQIRKSVKINPEVYTGGPYHSENLLWPIFPQGKIYQKSYQTHYFLVLNKHFQIRDVIVKNSQEIKICEEATGRSKQFIPEKDPFKCDELIFKSDWLKVTAESACLRLYQGKSLYPAPYQGPDFDVPGPYFTYPLFERSFFQRKAGNHRIVINVDCNIAGVLKFQKDFLEKIDARAYVGSFSKCERFSDHSIPGGTMGDITELL